MIQFSSSALLKCRTLLAVAVKCTSDSRRIFPSLKPSPEEQQEFWCPQVMAMLEAFASLWFSWTALWKSSSAAELAALLAEFAQ